MYWGGRDNKMRIRHNIVLDVGKRDMSFHTVAHDADRAEVSASSSSSLSGQRSIHLTSVSAIEPLTCSPSQPEKNGPSVLAIR